VDGNIDIDRVMQALEIANINRFVESLPDGLNTKIGHEGMGISTGQKQRILIARAVYKDPKFIFFDEATSSLDTTNERVIMDNLDAFFEGRTVIVIAHRLSTVKKADKIIVLKDGNVAEEGVHEELLANRGPYYNLVSDQLEMEKSVI
jgi:ATP-binding cassette subfamily B protein